MVKDITVKALYGTFLYCPINMRSQVLAFGISILLGVVLQSTRCQECPLHEDPVECIDFCNTCESDRRACEFICIPGCDCKPGYTRNKVGYCIPRRFCKDTEEIGYQGCPNVRKCNKSCTNRGFKSGTCVGRKLLKCQCHCIKPKVEEKPENYGCPNNAKCNTSCKHRGFHSGECTGVNRTLCKCKSHGLDTSPVGPDKNDTVAETGICPSTRRCVKSCKRQGFTTGRCEGYECRCLHRNPPEFPFPNRCNTYTCHADCIKRRYSYGACAGPTDVCRCFY